ncbi:MAG: MBOAT family O-acyltransferase [Phycisphaerales bacterium]
MDILSVQFWGFVLAAWLAIVIFDGPRSRRLILLAASAVFLTTLLGGDGVRMLAARLGALAGFIGLGLLGLPAGRAGARDTAAGRWSFRAWFLVYLAAYVVLTKPEALPLDDGAALTQFVVQLVGLSYILLRQLHVALDLRNGLTYAIRPLDAILHLVCFNGLLAGPVQRYPEFSAGLDQLQPARTMDEILPALSRIMTGLIKKFVLAAIIWEAIDSPRSGVGPMKDPKDFLIAFHLFAVWEYLEFSGYMDMMIGIGRLLGIHTPENFRRPYLARNTIDFWTRWHITLATWIRDYLFTPLSIRLGRVTGGRMLLVGFVAYLAAFIVVGLWHEIGWGFFLWGASQGLALGVVKVYDGQLRRWFGRKGHQRYMKSRIIRVITTVLTIEYFVLSVGIVLLTIWDRLDHLILIGDWFASTG